MADPSPAPSAGPALGSTADTSPYVSLSWMAVAADAVAGLFVSLLLALGVAAFLSKKPLLTDELLVLPVIGIVLSFAARRLIRNSEGTRTGENLSNAAWWICVVGGLAFAAYLGGVSFSIRRDAATEAEKWVGYLTADEGSEKNFYRAFIRTQQPDQRGSYSPDDPATLYARHRSEIVALQQSDLVQLTRRNPGGACKFLPTGVKDWVYSPGMIKCSFSGNVRCPEGVFPIQMDLRGFDAGLNREAVGRQWAITPGQGGFVMQDKVARTAYGWRVAELEGAGGEAGRAFVMATGQNAWLRARLYQTEISPNADHAFWAAAPLLSAFRGMTRVDPFVILPLTPEYPKYIQGQFLRLPGGAEPPPQLRDQFLRAWLDVGLFLPGRRIQGNDKLDVNSGVSFTDTSVEVRVPCEVPVAGSAGAARGRLVMECTEPDVVAELKQLRGEANPDQAVPRPESFGRRAYKWRVVRVESDMFEVKAPGPGGGPPPPG